MQSCGSKNFCTTCVYVEILPPEPNYWAAASLLILAVYMRLDDVRNDASGWAIGSEVEVSGGCRRTSD